MPRLSRWFVRSALVHLVIGFGAGAALLCVKAGLADPLLWVWLPAHADALLAGWMIQLACGVGYWILPRLGAAGRGRSWLAVLAFVLLNAESALCLGSGALRQAAPGEASWMALFAAGVALQTLALCAFAAHAWPRVLRVLTVSV